MWCKRQSPMRGLNKSGYKQTDMLSMRKRNENLSKYTTEREKEKEKEKKKKRNTLYIISSLHSLLSSSTYIWWYYIWIAGLSARSLMFSIFHRWRDSSLGMWVLFQSFFLFFNFCRVGFHNETCVALANTWWNISKNRIENRTLPSLLMVIASASLLLPLRTRYTHPPNRVQY